MSFHLSAEEEISFDDLEEETSIEPEERLLSSVKGLKFSLYADVTLNGHLKETTDSTLSNYIYLPSLSFGQNHVSLIGSVENEHFMAEFDTSLEAQFFEFSFFTDWGSITLGKIFPAFGSPDYHHIYGGYAGETGFLPFYWTDYGIKADFNVSNWLSIDAGISNGFPAINGTPLLSSTTATDMNYLKMLTLRFDFKPTLKTGVSFSFLLDSFDEDNPTENYIWMYGADFLQKFGSFTFRAGGALTEVRIASEGMDQSLLFPLTYYRLGWYTELTKKFEHFRTRLRLGGVDPDSRNYNQNDMLNANIGFFIPMGPLEFQSIYLYNWSMGEHETLEPDMLTGKSHELLLKLLIRL